MIIKINDFHPIPYYLRLSIVNKYIKEHSYEEKNNNGFLGVPNIDYKIQTTGKWPEVIQQGNSNYHVACKKTNTMYVFDVWFAV